MNKAEYMLRLERAIIKLPASTRNEILYDYEEHFRLGQEAGKTEEEIARELGTPEEIAAPYVENLPPPPPFVQNPPVSQGPSGVQKVLVALAVLFVNFAIVIPAVGGTIFGLWIGFGAICFSFFIAGISIVIVAFFQPYVANVALFLIGLAFLAITFPLCYAFYRVSVWLGKVIVKYVKFCVNLIDKGAAS